MRAAEDPLRPACKGGGHRRILFALLAAGLSSVSAAAAESGNPYEYDVSAFTKVDPAQLAYAEQAPVACGVAGARALAISAADEICVAGEAEAEILSREGAPVARFALGGPAGCVAFLPGGDLLVGYRDHVARLDRKGAVQAEWVGMGENAVLTSLAVGDREVMVADAGNRVVWRFDPDGRLKGRVGGGGEDKPHHFVVPSPYFDVAVRGDRTWIANPGRQRVEEYSADGRPQGQWGAAGMGMDRFCGCCNPIQLALQPDGTFVTGEKGIPRVKVLDAKGNLLRVVAGADAFSSDGEGCRHEATILDLAVDATGRVLVLDGKRGQLRVFVKKPAAAGSKPEGG